MLGFDESVEVQRKGSGVVFRFDCSYPHELSAELDEKDLKRLGRLFIALGNGKKRAKLTIAAKSGDLDFKLCVSARRDRFADKPRICFGYSCFNRELERVSDINIYFDCYGSASLLRFGKELLSLNDGDVSVLCEKEGEI